MLKIFSCLSISTIGRCREAVKAVCVHIHVSDNRETMSDAENIWLPVDVDNREKFWDDKNGLRAFSRER